MYELESIALGDIRVETTVDFIEHGLRRSHFNWKRTNPAHRIFVGPRIPHVAPKSVSSYWRGSVTKRFIHADIHASYDAYLQDILETRLHGARLSGLGSEGTGC